MKRLLKRRSFIISAAIIILILGGLIIAWQSALYTLNHMGFKNVTPSQLAADMRQDEFWSSNRFNTLVFDGKIKSVKTNDDKTTLEFTTSDTYSASCELNSSNTMFKLGETYKFAAETYQAERLPTGVLLHNCVFLNS